MSRRRSAREVYDDGQTSLEKFAVKRPEAEVTPKKNPENAVSNSVIRLIPKKKEQ